MEKDTVTISLDYYNKLRDFKLNHIGKYKRVGVNLKDGYGAFLLTNDEVLISIQEKLSKLEESHRKLSISYSSLSRMTIREFKKWKNEHKT
jgi:hypothetical protein